MPIRGPKTFQGLMGAVAKPGKIAPVGQAARSAMPAMPAMPKLPGAKTVTASDEGYDPLPEQQIYVNSPHGDIARSRLHGAQLGGALGLGLGGLWAWDAATGQPGVVTKKIREVIRPGSKVPGLALRVGAAGLAGAIGGGFLGGVMARPKTAAKKEIGMRYEWVKKAGWSEHGRKIQKVRAKAHDSMSEGYDKANRDHPGMAALKGTGARGAWHKLRARKEAYKSQQTGLNNLKAKIPFVGMGRKGQEALEKVKKEASSAEGDLTEGAMSSAFESVLLAADPRPDLSLESPLVRAKIASLRKEAIAYPGLSAARKQFPNLIKPGGPIGTVGGKKLPGALSAGSRMSGAARGDVIAARHPNFPTRFNTNAPTL